MNKQGKEDQKVRQTLVSARVRLKRFPRTESDWVETYEEAADYFRFLHAAPYLMVIGALFFACAWCKETCCKACIKCFLFLGGRKKSRGIKRDKLNGTNPVFCRFSLSFADLRFSWEL